MTLTSWLIEGIVIEPYDTVEINSGHGWEYCYTIESYFDGAMAIVRTDQTRKYRIVRSGVGVIYGG